MQPWKTHSKDTNPQFMMALMIWKLQSLQIKKKKQVNSLWSGCRCLQCQNSFVDGMRLFPPSLPPSQASYVNVIVLVRRHAFCGSDEKFTNVVTIVWWTFVIFVVSWRPSARLVVRPAVCLVYPLPVAVKRGSLPHHSTYGITHPSH